MIRWIVELLCSEFTHFSFMAEDGFSLLSGNQPERVVRITTRAEFVWSLSGFPHAGAGVRVLF